MRRCFWILLPALTLALACKPEPEPEPEPPVRATMQGHITWQVDFDAAAEAAGHTDCRYTRTYTGVQNDSAPWKCGSCSIAFQSTIEVTEGRADCYDQLYTGEPITEEWIGFDGTQWYRAQGGGPMGLQGNYQEVEGRRLVENSIEDRDAPNGGTFDFSIAGTLEFDQELGDPRHGFTPPSSYDCDWPKADPAPYDGNYLLYRNRLVPDAWLQDVCEQTVRLHDFRGRYFIVDISAIDCPPCQQMASQEEAWLEDMDSAGLDVSMITLLAPSLSDTAGTPNRVQLQQWMDDYGIEGAVLADRGWALSVAEPALGDSFGYPTAIIVAPDLRVIDFWTGFGADTWTRFEQVIRDHMAAN